VAEIAVAHVTLVPVFKGGASKISSELSGPMDKAGRSGGKRFGGGMSAGLAGIGSKIFAPLAAAGAAVSVGDFLKDAVGEARESQKVGAITANVIKTTGGAANVSAGQVGKLATAISNKSGIDDEAIQSASNLLLTFTNVRNEVGKGNNVFDQATQAATDMGAALGKDPKAAAIQLGKALNDPVKGVTALSRSGVSFTKQQKEQIKTMVGSGNTLGAQKLILGELNKEFGGTAAASATAGEKMKVAFGNFKEQIGTALLPIIDQVATIITTKVIPALSGFFTEMQTGQGAGGRFVQIAKSVWAAIKQVIDFIVAHKDAIGTYFKIAFVVSSAPIRFIVAAVRTIIAIVKAVIAAVRATVGAFKSAWNAVKTATSTAWNAIRTAVSTAWGKIKSAVSTGIAAVRSAIDGLSSIPGKVGGFFQRAYDAVRDKIGAIVDFVRGLPGKITGALGNIGSILYSAGASVIQGFLDGIQSAFGRVRDTLSNLTNLLPDWKGPATKDEKILRPSGQKVIGGFVTGLEDEYGSVKSSLHGLTRSMTAHGTTTTTADGGVVGRGVNVTYTGDVTVTDYEEFKREDNTRLRDFMTMANLAGAV
jgi:phage-related protein